MDTPTPTPVSGSATTGPSNTGPDVADPSSNTGSARLPWRSLIVLAGVTFVVVGGQMLPLAVLPAMGADLGVREARIGLLVSAWALVVAAATYPLVRLTAAVDRRRIIVVGLLVFAVANAGTGLADGFGQALAARVLGAAVCGVLWATVNARVAALVAPERLARAVATVLGGATLGSVLVLPAANALSEVWGWRLTFITIAVLSVAVAAAVQLTVGSAPATRAQPSPPGALGRLLAFAALGGVAFASHFAAFTFVTVLLAHSPAPGGPAALLTLFGVLGAVAVGVVGRLGDRDPRTSLVLSTTALSLVLMSLLALGRQPLLDLVLVAAWGLASGALGPLVQTVVMAVAGEEHRTVGATVIPIALNLGIAAGAAAGSTVVDLAGAQALPPVAAVVAGVAAVGLRLVARAADRRSGRRRAPVI